MRGLEKRQLLAERREKMARVAVEAAKQRYDAAVETETAQVRRVAEVRQTAEQRRRERNRALLARPATVARMSLVAAQFSWMADGIAAEEARRAELAEAARERLDDLNYETEQLKFQIIKQRKLEALQEKLAKRLRRQKLRLANGG